MECIGISPTAASLAAADELKIKWRHDNQNIRERERSHFTATHPSGTSSNGGSYSTTETRIRQDHATNETTIIGYLRLYNVSYANAGRYQCVISNAFGTTYSQRFKVSIGSKLEMKSIYGCGTKPLCKFFIFIHYVLTLFFFNSFLLSSSNLPASAF